MFPTVPYLILSPGNLFHTLFTTRYSKKLLPKKRCPIQASCSSGCCCCAACKMELNTCENTQAVTQMHPHTVAYDARTCTITSCSLCPFIRRHSLEHRISYTAHPSSLSLLYPSVRLSLRLRHCIFCGQTDAVAPQPQLSLEPATRMSPVDCQLIIRLHLCEMVKCQNEENVHEMILICSGIETI